MSYPSDNCVILRRICEEMDRMSAIRGYFRIRFEGACFWGSLYSERNFERATALESDLIQRELVVSEVAYPSYCRDGALNFGECWGGIVVWWKSAQPGLIAYLNWRAGGATCEQGGERPCCCWHLEGACCD